MSLELYKFYTGSVTLANIIYNNAGQVWDDVEHTFVTWNDADSANYGILLVGYGGPLYAADFPSQITDSGLFTSVSFVLDGAQLAYPAGDTLLPGILSIPWN